MLFTLEETAATVNANRYHAGMSFIAITGSNGKTTTKKMLSQILRKAGRVFEFDHNSDNVEKISGELAGLQDVYDWAVVKIGAAIPGELIKAAQLVRPRMAIITNVGEAHLQEYGTLKNIAMAKSELLTVLTSEGIALLNRDNQQTRIMGKNLACKVVYFGLSPLSDYYADDIHHFGPEGTSFTIHKSGAGEERVRMAIFSLGDVYNALAAYAAASELGISSPVIRDALQDDFILPDGRGRMHTFADLYIIDDTHDATPQSFYKSTKSLSNFRDYAKRLIFVMGDLTNPGEQPQVQAMMGHYIAGMPIDVAVLVGPMAAATAAAITKASSAKKRVVKCPSTSAASSWLKNNIQPGDVVLVEGADSINTSIIVRDLVAFGVEKWGNANSPRQKTHTLI